MSHADRKTRLGTIRFGRGTIALANGKSQNYSLGLKGGSVDAADLELTERQPSTFVGLAANCIKGAGGMVVIQEGQYPHEKVFGCGFPALNNYISANGCLIDGGPQIGYLFEPVSPPPTDQQCLGIKAATNAVT